MTRDDLSIVMIIYHYRIASHHFAIRYSKNLSIRAYDFLIFDFSSSKNQVLISDCHKRVSQSHLSHPSPANE